MIYSYVKQVDISKLQADINNSYLVGLISNISLTGTVLSISSTIPLDIPQQRLLRDIIIAQKVPTAAEQYVRGVVMPSAKDFAVQLEKDFIAENILMGISQLNKTDAVLGVLSKQVNIPGKPEPISLTDTLHAECPSLTSTLKVLDWHIQHMPNYADLAPFITVARLTLLKGKIAKYLGV